MEFLASLDMAMLWQIQQWFRSDLLDRVMVFITGLGDGGLIWILLAALLCARKQTRKIGVAMGFGMLLCLLAGNFTLKPVFARARPFHIDPSISLIIRPPGEYSFPSGHTMNSFSAASAIFFHNRRWGCAALLGASLIAFSRLYLMVHFPSDVLGGAFIGLLGGYLGYRISQKTSERLP